MSAALHIRRAGPSMLLQDMGRPGCLSAGLSRGGAADPLALAEGAALLGQSPRFAAIEMAGFGGTFDVLREVRVALTGAPMIARLDGAALRWNASHLLPAGARLELGALKAGSYGYLHLGGGANGPVVLGAASAHMGAGIGARLGAGDRIAAGPDARGDVGLCLDPPDRFSGGAVRLVESYQSDLFAPAQRTRFAETCFRRATRANRMGVQLDLPGDGFLATGGRSVLSDVIVPGDIQITGDGTPVVLMCECQTTGGYPRIGTVLPCDMPIVAQAPAGAPLRFVWVSLDDAVQIEAAAAKMRTELRAACRPVIRDPHMIGDLLSYQLISGMVTGDEE